MMDLLLYEGKAAVILLVFYLFYRFLLKNETFHKFNRTVLIATAGLSLILPLCIITIRKPVNADVQSVLEPVAGIPAEVAHVTDNALPSWQYALAFLFLAGVVFTLARVAASILSVNRIIRQGKLVAEEDRCRIVITGRDIVPFSWMRYIVISEKDWEGMHDVILIHEKAHIAMRHSLDVLLVDVLSAFQWFNPAVWMLRSDLQEIHEYEADEAVLNAGADIKEYQYLLIKKAVGKSGYSVANSFNHSILKNRITMMSKSKSPLSRRLRVLYLFPLVGLCISLQAKTVYVPTGENNQKVGILKKNDAQPPLYILRQVWGDEEITKEELDKIESSRIKKIEILNDATAMQKYGERGTNGVIVVTMKMPQELDEIVVVSYLRDKDELVPFYLVKPATMPTFQGEGMAGFSRWLNERIQRPQGCSHQGTMEVSFVVGTDGAVKDVTVQKSVCEELDAMVVSIIEKSPKWEPATVSGGRPAEQCLTIPIVFEIR